MVEFPNELDYKRLIFGGIKVAVVKSAESSHDDFTHIWDVLKGKHHHLQIAPQPAPKDPKEADECDTDDGEAIGLVACIDGFNCPLASMVCTNDIMVGKGQKAHRLKPQIPWLLEDVWKFKRLKDVQSVALDYVKEVDLQVYADDALADANNNHGNNNDEGLEGSQRLYYFENCFAALVIHTEPVASLEELLNITVRYGTLVKKKHPLLLALHFIIASKGGLSMLGPLEVVKLNEWLMYSELYRCFYINVAKEAWCDHLLVNVNHSELVCVYDPNENNLEKLLEPLVHNMIGILLRQWLDYLHETIEPCLPDLIIVAHGTNSPPSSHARRRVTRLIKAITRADLYMLIGNFYSAAKHYYAASGQAEGYGEYLYKGAADFGAALAVLAMKLDNCNWDMLSDLTLLQHQSIEDSQRSEFLDDSPIACASSHSSESAAEDCEIFINADIQDISADLVNDTSQMKGRKFTASQQQIAISLQQAFYAWIRCEHDPRARLGILSMFMIDWFWQQGMDRLAHYYIGKSVALMDKSATAKFMDAAIARTCKGRFKRKLHLYRFTSLLHGSAIESELADSNNEVDVVVVEGDNNADDAQGSWLDLVVHVLDPSRMYADVRPNLPNWWTIREAWLKATMRQCDLAQFPKLALEWFANLMNNLTCDTTPQSIVSGITQYRRMLEIRGFPLPILTYVVVPIATLDTLAKLRNQCLAFKSWPTAQLLYLGGHYDLDIRPMVLCKLIPCTENSDDNVNGGGGNGDDDKDGTVERAEYSKLHDDAIKASLSKHGNWRHARQRIFKLKRTTGHLGTCRCRFSLNRASSARGSSRSSGSRSRRLGKARVYTPLVQNHSCVLVPIPYRFLACKGLSSDINSSDEGLTTTTALPPPEANCIHGNSPLGKTRGNGGHHIHVYVNSPLELRLELANLLPVDVILENVQVLVATTTATGTTEPSDAAALVLNSKSIMVPANSTSHCEIVEIVAKERGIYKVYGISFEVFKFRCIQAFLSNAHLDIERNPWLIVDALENIPQPSIDVFMANTSFGESRLQSMVSSSQYHTIDDRQLTLPSISTSSLNPMLSERYEYWNGIRMPTFDDATLPQRVNSCMDADCITCSSLHNIVLTEPGSWDKLIEGERKLLYIVLKNTRTDGVVFKSLDLSIKSLEQKPLLLAAASSSSQLHGLLGIDKQYHIKRSKIMTKAQQLNYTQCIKLLLKNAVYTSKTPRSARRGVDDNNNDEDLGEYVIGSHVHARGPLALVPGDELLIPMVYKANCKSRKFQIHLQAVIDTSTGQKRVTYAAKHFEFQVLPAIKVSKTRLDFFSNLDYSHEQVLSYIQSSNLYSHDLLQLLAPIEGSGRRNRLQRRHVFDSGSFSLALYLVNCTDYNFICHCRLADNSHLVASMGSESLWCLKVPKIGYMHARGMKPMSFLQHLESRLGLEWTCFPNKSGEIAISTIADAGNNTSQEFRQKGSSGTKAPANRRRMIDKYKSGLNAFYKRNQIWRLHGLEELANVYYLYSRVPKNLHAKLQHVIESLVTIRVIVTSINNIAKSTTFRQLPCGSTECYTTKLYEPFKIFILARVNGTCTIANYRAAIIPYIFGTFAPPNGLVYKGSLELQPTVPLGPSCSTSSATHSRIVHRCTSNFIHSENDLNNKDFTRIAELQASTHKARVYALNVAIATPSTCFWHHKQILIAAE